MSETSTTNTSTKNTKTNEGCCGGHHDHAKKHKPGTTTPRGEAEAISVDQANADLSDKSSCCCGGKHD